jgi:cytochrome P450
VVLATYDREAMVTPSSTRYDPLIHSAVDDPYPIYARLRRSGVHHCHEREVWVLSRFSDVQAAARDWRTFASGDGVDIDETASLLGPHILDMDPPRHDELRDLVRDEFSPKRVRALEEEVRTGAVHVLSAARGQGELDFAADFAWPIPVRGISALMGFPPSDAERLQRWAEEIAVRTPGDRRLPEVAMRGAGEFVTYLRGLLGERRRAPREDLLSRIVAAEARGEMAPAESFGMAFVLFTAAIETSASLIASLIDLLAKHPEQRAAVAREPSKLAVAVEEAARYDAPVQYLMRTARSDVTISGTRIPCGSRVLVLFGSANRDERRYESPDEFNVDREPKRHLGFGEGIHHCLGAPLARLEARIALEVLLETYPRYKITRPPVRVHTHTTRAISSLSGLCEE